MVIQVNVVRIMVFPLLKPPRCPGIGLTLQIQGAQKDVRRLTMSVATSELKTGVSEGEGQQSETEKTYAYGEPGFCRQLHEFPRCTLARGGYSPLRSTCRRQLP